MKKYEENKKKSARSDRSLWFFSLSVYKHFKRAGDFWWKFRQRQTAEKNIEVCLELLEKDE